MAPKEKLSLYDLDELLKYLRPIQEKWHDIGLQLGLPTEQLHGIATDNQTDEECLQSVLELWLGGSSKVETTWEALYRVLDQNVEGGGEVAEAILQEKVSPTTSNAESTERQPFRRQASHPNSLSNRPVPKPRNRVRREKHPPPLPERTPSIAHHERNEEDLISYTPPTTRRRRATKLPPPVPKPRRHIETTHEYTVVPNASVPSRSLPCTHKDRITLEGETKRLKTDFSALLLAVTNVLKDVHPQDLTRLLSCYEDRYSTLTKHCLNTEDIIQVLVKNISFVDYDLLSFVLKNMNHPRISFEVDLYSQSLQQYLRKRMYSSAIDQDKKMLPVDIQMGIHASDKQQRRKLIFIAESIAKEEIELNELTKADADKDPSVTVSNELRGVEVLQTTEVVVTNLPQLFEWRGYGLKLQIPENSLPETVEHCIITIKATLAGQYHFPPNTELVSPVFWLRCEPQCKFNAPLTLSIQHCALPRNSFRLFIARAQCTQTDLPYSFKVLHGGTFSEHSSYGVIELNRFSGVAVVQERSDERRYWSSVYYMGPPNNREIHFTVTWHDDAHVTTVNNKYSQRKAIVGPEQSITFKETTIALDIPREGHVLAEKWKVFPTIPPKIVKREVDNHKPEQERTVPHCELVAMWTAEDKHIQPLIHTVDILGAEEEEKYFTINIHPGQKVQDSEEIETESTSNKSLQIQHLHSIKECLKLVSPDKIKEVGLALGLNYTNLLKMNTVDMIHAWLQKTDNVLGQSGEPTVQSLITALESSDLMGTVDVVRSKFIT